MHVPSFLDSLIREDVRLSAGVGTALAAIDPIIRSSRLPFFPEYTDHGPQHNEEVLQTAVDIIHDDGRPLLTPQDAAILVLAVLLHDCGMHLTEDGFISLIQPGCRWTGVPAFADRPWSELWEEFIADARKFDDRKLTALFGDPEPIRRPPLDPAQLTERDKLLIGEFLRRQHPRLGHDIALRGIPATGCGTYPVLTGVSNDLSDLAGVVARSHGVPLRNCLDYLSTRFHLREFQGVHAIFLMILLRIADYLQIQPTRAPREVLEVRKVRSPISQSEWKVHASVRNITTAADDPESVLIDAAPADVVTFLRVTDWLAGLQRELDISWAVLGEVYGRFEELNALALRLRRVRSNLDDREAFSDQVDYIPQRATFEAANPDLLKLLVSPLYDDDPAYGMRELLQNALDAVRELHAHLEQHPKSRAVELTEQEADVELAIECVAGEPAWFIVSDKGIGMTVNTILDYFLKAGASLRTSEAWRSEFQDESGRSTVLRSGRFGIGVLAAFLIGDELEVSTRYVAAPSNRGITFRANLDTNAIALKWTRRPVGTTVRIKVGSRRIERLNKLAAPSNRWDRDGEQKWDFYCLDWPKVVRRVTSAQSPLKQRFAFKFVPRHPPPHWKELNVPEYENVLWTYERVPHLVCNGLVVEREVPYRRDAAPGWRLGAFSLRRPHVQVFDPDGRLPLNLQRNSLVGDRLPFDDRLLEAVFEDFAEYAIDNGPNGSPIEAVGYFDRYARLTEEGYWVARGQCSPWVWTRSGLSVADAVLLNMLKIQTLLFVPPWMSAAFTDAEAKRLLTSYTGGIVPIAQSASRSERTLAREFISPIGSTIAQFVKESRGLRVLYREELCNYILSLKTVTSDEERVLKERAEVLSHGQWILGSIGECPDEPQFRFAQFLEEKSEWVKDLGLIDVAVELYRSEESLRMGNSKLAEIWTSVIGGAAIPFGDSKRRALKELLSTVRAGR